MPEFQVFSAGILICVNWERDRAALEAAAIIRRGFP
jgi:hypothetical protein